MLIVYFGCKIREKAPLRGLIFGIKGIQIGKMQEKQMQPIDFSHISTTNKHLLPSLFCAK